MFDSATKEFLEGGNPLIIATVSPSGEPYASRGWGLTALPGAKQEMRLLLSSDDPVTVAHLAAGGAVAVTAADVRTYRSMQVKGRASGVEPATDDDRARAARYAQAFFTAVVETDGAYHEQVVRLEPYDYVACTIVIDDIFDQTPGPGAGGRVGEATA